MSGTPAQATTAGPRARGEGGGPRRPWHSHGWRIVGALSVTEVVSWGVVYYAFSVFLVPMRRELGYSTAELTGAFSTALLISAVAGIAVGRYLDSHSPRTLMTLGSIAATVLVVAWSQVHGLAAYYAVWAALGLVMAAVLYEPAFVVLAKWFPDAQERRRAMTALTLVAALASFIFLPVSQALVDARGWRDALLVLALILGVVTIPIHALMLRRAPYDARLDRVRVRERSAEARAVLRSRGFRLLCAAFCLATATGIAMTVLAIPYLVGRGFAPGFCAFAVGLVGLSQIPGRIVFAAFGSRLRRSAVLAGVFALVAAGIAVLVAAQAPAAVIVGVVLLGMGNGMTTLARATIIADRYGAAVYGAVSGVAASATTSARAAGPVAAAAFAAATSYTTLLWTLAALALGAAALGYTAERPESPAVAR